MNIDFYTKAEIDANLGGLSFAKISKAEYDAIAVKDPNTIYYVYDENGNITQYVGTAQMSSGGAANAYVLSNSAGAALLGVGEFEEV